MIDPFETRSPLFSILLNTPLYAVLANVDGNGELSPKETGPQGSIVFIPQESCQSLAGNLWIVCDRRRLPGGIPIGNTVQIYAPGKHLAREIGGDRDLNPWVDAYGPPALVVSAFTSGITGADRAMAQAMANELADIDYMHALDAHSNGVLAHALYTNLRETISLEEHLANINELEGYAAASSGEIGDEIRVFLSSMRNPRDRIGRYNTYRKVLIVRAIQRRVKGIVNTKLDRVQEIVAAQNATATYIADVDALAGRLTSVLTDKQPWWTNNSILPSVNRRMRRKFVDRLQGYVNHLETIHANPFRTWAMPAAGCVRDMIHKLESERFAGIGNDSMMARGYLEAMRVQERVSRGIIAVRQEDGSSAAHDAFASVINWSLETAPGLHIPAKAVRTLIQEGQLGQRTPRVKQREDALRNIEWALMAVGVARAA